MKVPGLLIVELLWNGIQVAPICHDVLLVLVD